MAVPAGSHIMPQSSNHLKVDVTVRSLRPPPRCGTRGLHRGCAAAAAFRSPWTKNSEEYFLPFAESEPQRAALQAKEGQTWSDQGGPAKWAVSVYLLG